MMLEFLESAIRLACDIMIVKVMDDIIQLTCDIIDLFFRLNVLYGFAQKAYGLRFGCCGFDRKHVVKGIVIWLRAMVMQVWVAMIWFRAKVMSFGKKHVVWDRMCNKG